MKRLIAMLLTVMLLAAMTTAFAENEAQEIVWQDIPWGSSYSETVKLLIDKKIISTPNDLMKGDYADLSPMGVFCSFMLEDGMLDDDPWSPKYYNSHIIVATNRSSGLSFKFGGYEVRSITLIFTPDEKLMSIMITPNGADYDDLTGKLSSVYGEPSIEDPFVIRGGNQTAVAYDYMNGAIVYGKTTWNEVLPDTETKAPADASDLGGL